MPASKYTETQRAEALRLYESDGPTAVEDQLGIPKNTVSSWAKKAGVRTVRTTKTNAATEAKQADAKAMRAALSTGSLGAAQKTLALINLMLDGPLEITVKDAATVLGILADKHIALNRVDQAQENHSAVDAWLNHIMGDDNGTIGETK